MKRVGKKILIYKLINDSKYVSNLYLMSLNELHNSQVSRHNYKKNFWN